MKKSCAMFFPLTAVMLLVLVFSMELSAYPTGRTGATLKSGTDGCSCHNPSTVISGAITGPTTVTAGQTYTYTLTITMPSGSGDEGVDIAVQNGTLAVIAGSGLKLSSGELTHSSALPYVNPNVIQFNYTAPALAGPDILYATVARGYGGAWRFTPNFGITVQSPSLSLGLTALISGNYNGTTMIPKNVTVELHNATTPYALVESKTVLLNSSGVGNPSYTSAVNGTQYYIVLKFDNGLETWSATPQTFSGSALNYDFTTAAAKAYGSNMILVGTKYCIISGDVDQDGSVGALDRSACWNDRNLTGTYMTDLDGDGSVGALDRSICWNNRNLSVQKPVLALSSTRRIKQAKNEDTKGKIDLKIDGSNSKIVLKKPIKIE